MAGHARRVRSARTSGTTATSGSGRATRRSDRRGRGPRRRRPASTSRRRRTRRQAGAARGDPRRLARSHGVPVVYVTRSAATTMWCSTAAASSSTRRAATSRGRRVRGGRRGRRPRRAGRRHRVAARRRRRRVSGARDGPGTTRASAASRRAARALRRHRLGAGRRGRRRCARPRHVLGVAMPAPFSCQGSVDDRWRSPGARDPPRRPDRDLIATSSRRSPIFAGRAVDVTEENLQARIRGNVLMALSNSRRAGAHHGQQVRARGRLLHALRRHVGRARGDRRPAEDRVYAVRVGQPRGGAIPRTILTKAPSAELRPTRRQDRCRRTTCSTRSSRATSRVRGAARDRRRRLRRDDRARVLRMVRTTRVQAPPGPPALLVTKRKAFGPGRLIPDRARRLAALTGRA